jgi:hypothetical protein
MNEEDILKIKNNNIEWIKNNFNQKIYINQILEIIK